MGKGDMSGPPTKGVGDHGGGNGDRDERPEDYGDGVTDGVVHQIRASQEPHDRGAHGEVKERRAHAAAPWAGVSVLAARFCGRGHAEVGIPSSRSNFCAKASDGVFPPASS